jgi:hypothetical protein
VAKRGRATWLDPHDLPAEVKRGVSERDEERCSYRSADGEAMRDQGVARVPPCRSVRQGRPPTVENCALFCRNHNQYAADVDYGRAFMERMRAKGRGAREDRAGLGGRLAQGGRLAPASRSRRCGCARRWDASRAGPAAVRARELELDREDVAVGAGADEGAAPVGVGEQVELALEAVPGPGQKSTARSSPAADRMR